MGAGGAATLHHQPLIQGADDRPRPLVALARAGRLRCPSCGRARMFRRWLHMIERCPACHFRFDRGEPDYFIGAYTVNLIVAELIVVAAFVTVMLVTWPDVPWSPMKWWLLPFVIAAPVVTYPFSKAAWVAIDLIFRRAGT